MRQSRLFTQTRKEAPSDEVSRNAKLLIRGGFIHKEMAGVYAYLPLGLKVLRKIEAIVREEMNNVGGQEVQLTALQSKDLWETTDRWSDEIIDVWFKTALKSGGEVGLATTHEEPLTQLMTKHVSSYRDLPAYPYQFQTKFRNELRAKSGIMRGREFLMKDLYSFSRTQDEHESFYEQMKKAYENIFERVGIGEQTHFTYASGGSFSEASHEFQTISSAGEDTIYISDEKSVAINEEMMSYEVLEKLGVSKDELREETAIEVGNIFPLGTKFSDSLGLMYKDEEGEELPVIMGSYGIGLGRVMGTVVEVLSDDDGIVWPESVAPFQVHLVQLTTDDPQITTITNDLYEQLQQSGVEVLWDDRESSAGEKFSDSDLLGIPHRVVVSGKTLKDNTVGYQLRADGEERRITQDELSVLLEE